MDNKTSMDVFEKALVPQAVLKNAIPAMAAMLMVLAYNLADTFFIGQTHNDIRGIIYIPALFILQTAFEVTGLAWAQPAADLLSTVLAAPLYFYVAHKLITSSTALEKK